MRTVLVLANSHKLQGRCVAGIDLATQRWVRPLGSMRGGALLPVECLATTPRGSLEVTPGDVIEMSDGIPCASAHHPEDVERTSPWRIVGRMEPREIERELHGLTVREGPLLGLHARDVPLIELKGRPQTTSLQLARCSRAELYWRQRVGHQRQLRARVRIADVEEDLAVTDARIETKMARRAEATLAQCLLTVSLSEPYERAEAEWWCTKLIAGVMQLP